MGRVTRLPRSLALLLCTGLVILCSSAAAAAAGSGHALQVARQSEIAMVGRYLTCNDFGVGAGGLRALTFSWWVRIDGVPLDRIRFLSMLSASPAAKEGNYFMTPFSFTASDQQASTWAGWNQVGYGFEELRWGFYPNREPPVIKFDFYKTFQEQSWNHFTMTWESAAGKGTGTLKQFVNGEKVDEVNDAAELKGPFPCEASDQMALTVGPFFDAFAKGSVHPDTGAHVLIDELAIYNQALSEATVKASWQQKILAHAAGLVFFYDFDEGGIQNKVSNRATSATAGTELVLGSHFITGQYYTRNTELFEATTAKMVPSFAPVQGGSPATVAAAQSPVMRDSERPCISSGLPGQFKCEPRQIRLAAVEDQSTRPFEASAFGFDGFPLDCFVTELPPQGTLYQASNMSSAQLGAVGKPFAKAGEKIDNPLQAVVFKPSKDGSGVDYSHFKFKCTNQAGLSSPEETVVIDVDKVDDHPQAKSMKKGVAEDSAAGVKITLDADDPDKERPTVFVISEMPTKGRIFQRLPDPADPLKYQDVEITRKFDPFTIVEPIQQVASDVVAVSSFYGGTPNWSPLQAVGTQSVDVFGDSKLTWSPSIKTMPAVNPGCDKGCSNVTGVVELVGHPGCKCGGQPANGLVVNGLNRSIQYSYDPWETKKRFGYNEYIQLQFDTPVYPHSLVVGENRGMGSITHVRARRASPPHDLIQVWGSPIVDKSTGLRTGDGSIALEFQRAKMYRNFRPTLCRPAAKVDQIRLELDIDSVPDWNEIDYVSLIGATTSLRDGVLEDVGGKAPDLIYKPDPDAFGNDQFSFKAYDCAFSEDRSSKRGTVAIEISARYDPVQGRTSTIEQNFSQFQHRERVPITVPIHNPDLIPVRVTVKGVPKDEDVKIYKCSHAGKNASSASEVVQAGSVLQNGELCIEWANCNVRDAALDFEVQELSGPGASATPVTGRLLFRADCEVIDSGLFVLVTLLGVSGLAVAVILAAWMAMHLQHPTIKAAEPKFLSLVLLGYALSTASLFTFVYDDGGKPAPVVPSESNRFPYGAVNTACMAQPWLYWIGFSFSYSSLILKTWRVKAMMDRAKRALRESAHIKVSRVLVYTALIVGVQAVVLAAWTGVSPLVWERKEGDGASNPACALNDGKRPEGYREKGACTAVEGNVWPFVAILSVFQGAAYIYGNVLCYQARTVATVFSERKWITTAMVSNLQIFVISIPLLFIVADNANALAMVKAGCVFLNDSFMLGCVFGPKMYYVTLFSKEDIKQFMVEELSDQMLSTRQVVNTTGGRATLSKQLGTKRVSGAGGRSLASVAPGNATATATDGDDGGDGGGGGGGVSAIEEESHKEPKTSTSESR